VLQEDIAREKIRKYKLKVIQEVLNVFASERALATNRMKLIRKLSRCANKIIDSSGLSTGLGKMSVFFVAQKSDLNDKNMDLQTQG